MARLFMLVVFFVGLLLTFIGFTQSRASLFLNYPDFFKTDRAQASVADLGRCYDSSDQVPAGKPVIRELSHVFKVKLARSPELIKVIARGCRNLVIGNQIEVLDEGPNIRGEKMWSLQRDGLTALDLLGPGFFIFGLLATFFGARRVLFGFPQVAAPSR